MTTETQTTYQVTGMTCGHCEASVREEVEAIDGVTAATADRDTGTLTVFGEADVQAVRDAVAEAGYQVTS